MNSIDTSVMVPIPGDPFDLDTFDARRPGVVSMLVDLLRPTSLTRRGTDDPAHALALAFDTGLSCGLTPDAAVRFVAAVVEQVCSAEDIHRATTSYRAAAEIVVELVAVRLPQGMTPQWSDANEVALQWMQAARWGHAPSRQKLPALAALIAAHGALRKPKREPKSIRTSPEPVVLDDDEVDGPVKGSSWIERRRR